MKKRSLVMLQVVKNIVSFTVFTVTVYVLFPPSDLATYVHLKTHKGQHSTPVASKIYNLPQGLETY